MRQLRHVSLALLLIGSLWPQLSAQTRELIAVIDIRPVGATDIEASALTDRLREELLRTGKFTLVDRSQMENVLNEQALQQTGCTEQECAVQVGQILGVRKIIAGKVTKISDTLWQLSALMVDVETSETIRAESIQHRGDFFDLLTSQVPPLAAKLAADGSQAPAVAVLPPQAPPPAPPDAAAAGPDARPRWMLITGWTLVGLGILNQSSALTTNGEAEDKAQEARTNDNASQYAEAQTLRDEAEASQTAAVLLIGGGAGLLYYYYIYLPQQSAASTGSDATSPADMPLRIAAVGNGARVGWSWRW